MPACFADHLLLLAYSGFVLRLGILISGHKAELWDVAQLNHSLLCRHAADKIPGLPCLDYQSCPNFCLPGGFTILQHPLCMGQAVCHPLPRAKPSHHGKCLAVTTEPPTRVWSVQIQPLLHCSEQKWKGAAWDVYSEAVQNTFKKLLHWATSGSIRKGTRKKNNSIVQYCSFPTAYRESSICHEPVQARTLCGSCQPAMVVVFASCLVSGHSKCICRLYLSDSSLYRQFYCISQNQF